MKRISHPTLAVLIAVSLQAVLLAGCGGGPKPYRSGADDFSITFPRGSKLSRPISRDIGGEIVAWRHAATDKDSGYEIIVTRFPADFVRTYSAKEIISKDAESQRGAVIDTQETTFQGLPAIVSKREYSLESEMGYIKSVTFFVEPKHKLYAIRAIKKEKTELDSASVNDFINSFKLE